MKDLDQTDVGLTGQEDKLGLIPSTRQSLWGQLNPRVATQQDGV